MDGHAVADRHAPSDATEFDLPTVLSHLGSEDPAECRGAVEATAAQLAREPDACLPTVPKLRDLIERDEIECRGAVAACLATLATHEPLDVAPSATALVTTLTASPEDPALEPLFVCLRAISEAKPAALDSHVDEIASAVADRDDWHDDGLATLAALSRETPEAIAPAVPVLADALAAAPTENALPVLPTLGRVARSDASLPTLSFVDDAAALLEHDDEGVRREAVACLEVLAVGHPEAVDRVSSAL